ncbi:MAG: hypothetical protein LBV38_02950 [Alistipes sp.]|jgi:C-terminal processing protease CtpA/Prc|nr:hypothetical protein [Alistipes sp.]
MARYLHTLSIIATALVTALISACSDGFSDNSIDEALKLSRDSITVSLAAQTVSVGVTARDTNWSVTGGTDWLTVTPDSGGTGIAQITVAFTAHDNSEAPPRTATLTFTSGGSEKTIAVRQLPTEIVPPNINPDSPVNKLIKAELDSWYYNGETRDTPADDNQSYENFYTNYLEALTRNNSDGNRWATDNERYLYSYIERNPRGTAESNRPGLNYGMEFELLRFDNKLAGRVLYVEPGSPAATAGLVRGDWFYKVNDRQMNDDKTAIGWYRYNVQIDSLVNPVAGESPRLSMLSFRSSSMTLLDEGREVTLTPREWPRTQILGTQVFPTVHTETEATTYTGYMMLNSFELSPDALAQRFAQAFGNRPEGQPIENFILDLRYNKSGTVEAAETMGNLLVGNVEGVGGTTFATYEFATGGAGADKTVAFAPHPSGIAAKTVYILTSPQTAGASELLINALRGIDQSVVRLVVIGSVTQGLSAGMVKRTVMVGDDEWEYSAWMLAFRCVNAQGQGDYTYGLVPNGGEVNELSGDNLKWSNVWGWKGQLGATEDALVRRAVRLITGEEFASPGGVVNSSSHQRSGFPREYCFPTNLIMNHEL